VNSDGPHCVLLGCSSHVRLHDGNWHSRNDQYTRNWSWW